MHKRSLIVASEMERAYNLFTLAPLFHNMAWHKLANWPKTSTSALSRAQLFNDFFSDKSFFVVTFKMLGPMSGSCMRTGFSLSLRCMFVYVCVCVYLSWIHYNKAIRIT